ncbi:Phage virion morphogenesis family protein [Cohaesibacter sp. ES.047]|uniref:phage virion morphogenesis protein n=1 Tax=Cohaesibacter sp. ES.047 TaxID=1798205 RepID=UPI000BB8F766|nr:phage virion morphogenesis protein [Cohaesibacter sp. ES.047]SNY91392.1 Phage virion morphogenesis family protein [Cohaesibacter sp. ES.047]
MSGIEFLASLDATLPLRAASKLAALDEAELLDAVGAIGVSQSQRRISDEQAGPNGEAWPALNPEYAKGKRGAGGILEGEGDLITSMDHVVGSGEVSWGSPLVYAAIHHFGGVITPKNAEKLVFQLGGRTIVADAVTIPERPYLGISQDNAAEIEDTALIFIAEPFQ